MRLRTIRCLRLSRNFGKEAAIAAGLDKATGDAVILMDVDLQHPPDLIPRMLQTWKTQDVELAEAVKKTRGDEVSIKAVLSGISTPFFFDCPALT